GSLEAPFDKGERCYSAAAREGGGSWSGTQSCAVDGLAQQGTLSTSGLFKPDTPSGAPDVGATVYPRFSSTHVAEADGQVSYRAIATGVIAGPGSLVMYVYTSGGALLFLGGQYFGGSVLANLPKVGSVPKTVFLSSSSRPIQVQAGESLRIEVGLQPAYYWNSWPEWYAPPLAGTTLTISSIEYTIQ
ncbi:MAG: hypothetical protein ABIS18_00220, partial [Actinomycetota bacterium]